MSANAASLPCPICSHIGIFNSAQSLRDRLIFVSTNNLTCPVCQEDVCGLDKLTIHLFSHVKLPAFLPAVSATENCEYEKSVPDTSKIEVKPEQQNCEYEKSVPDILKIEVKPEQQKKLKPCASKNRPASVASVPVKYARIHPKPPVLNSNATSSVALADKSVNQVIEDSSHTSLPLLKTENLQVQTDTSCSVCGIKFSEAKILKMHTCLVHNMDENVACTRYDCHLCSKNFKMRGSLMVHLRVAHFGFSGNSSFKNSDKTKLDQCSGKKTCKSAPSDMNDSKQWQCDVCRKCFTTKYFLKKHKRLHTGETPYACTQCNKTFTFQQSYHKHLLYHNDEKPHTCSYCGRAFKELSTLHNHQRIHTGEKPFACETCGKCFRQRVSYLVHRRIHTGVMPYRCTACNKSFRYKVSQRTHKCQAQPPGTVVRQTGDLVEKLKKKQVPDMTLDAKAKSTDTSPLPETQQQHLPDFLEVSESNAELVRRGAKLSLEDMESENFTLIADHLFENTDQNRSLSHGLNEKISNSEATDDVHIESFIESVIVADHNLPSPSEIFKNLCLSKDEDFIKILDAPLDGNAYDSFNNTF